MGWRTRALNLLAIAFLVAACEPSAGRPAPGREAVVGPLVWPQPPERARIRFIKAVARPQDLGIQPSFWKRLGEIIVGKEEEWFIRPTAVAATEQAIYVADPGAQALVVLDPRAGRFRRIREAGRQRLVSPVAVAVGPGDRVYLADSYLAKVFVYDAGGKLTGTVTDPNLRRPAGVAYDGTRDRLYVADSAAHRVWIFAGDGRPVGAIGQRGSGRGEFNFPSHVAVDQRGTLYVTDALNFRVQIFRADGSFAGQFGRHGNSSGDFAMPKGVALDSEGHIYVVEALFDAVQIFDRQGRYLLTFGERGVGPGQFWLPGGIFVYGPDRIYVADSYNQRIQIFEYLAGGGDD